MNAAIALILLAEAATTCGQGATGRLRAGARIVRPVGTIEAPPFELLKPATPVASDGRPKPAAAGDAPESRDAAPPAEQCDIPIPIA